jgi:N-acetylmuramoyl-L-alanine amidase
MTDAGWRHVVVGARGVEGNRCGTSPSGSPATARTTRPFRKANPVSGTLDRKGDVILVPKDLLTAAFRGGVEGTNAPKTAEVRKSEDDPDERTPADGDAATATAAEAVAVGLPSLTYDRNAAEPYAVYRLQRGEALYSSVAIRFTGRVYANDVGDVVERIVSFNGIDDVARIPVGYAVKIPMTLLLPEHLPPDDPTRLAAEYSKRASAKLARRARAAGLAGVHVILDAGHGGRDPGSVHDDVYEAGYVYDVMCRLKKLLEKKSAATVSATTKSKGFGYAIADDDEIDGQTDHVVLTSPKYTLEDAVVGVNLRWYLANSIFRRAMRRSVAREKVVFISIHADSLHPSLRGAMAYVPGERLRNRLVPEDRRHLPGPRRGAREPGRAPLGEGVARRGGAVAPAGRIDRRCLRRERPEGPSLQSGAGQRCARRAANGSRRSSAITSSPPESSWRSATSVTRKTGP